MFHLNSTRKPRADNGVLKRIQKKSINYKRHNFDAISSRLLKAFDLGYLHTQPALISHRYFNVVLYFIVISISKGNKTGRLVSAKGEGRTLDQIKKCLVSKTCLQLLL